ncbi:hypothetical protein K523DRAFT_329232 [Schizophyllum commune Tattone D]|nr:hypothetical protein K523DRAFT_329232 [Schizophyllum commune Tattone D]
MADATRATYKFQPDLILCALRSLLNALARLVENEFGGKAVFSGWAETKPEDGLKKWAEHCLELQPGLKRIFQEGNASKYAEVKRERLGLLKPIASDESTLIRALLSLTENRGFDFHLVTFRALCDFSPELTP